MLTSLKVEGCQNSWLWASSEPFEQAWTMVERKIYSGKYMESYDSGNKCRNNSACIVSHT